MDKHHKDMISSLKLAPGDEVLVPDYLFETLSKDLANARIIPYSAAAQLKSPVPDRAIVHKGLMPRLPRQSLQALVIHGDIVHANEVFVVFARHGGGTKPSVLDVARRRHSQPVLDYVKRDIRVRPRSTDRRAVVVSAFGVGNVGDDAVSFGAREVLYRSGFDEVALVGPNPDYSVIDTADLVVVGGGGLLYDSSFSNVSNYTAPIRYAYERGIPSAVLGVGAQGIRTTLGAAAYKDALSLARLVTVRERSDATLLTETVGLKNVHTTGDLALLLADGPRPVPVRRDPNLAVLSLSHSLESWLAKRDSTIDAYLDETLDSLGKGYNTVVGVVHSVDDEAIYERLRQRREIHVVKAAEFDVSAIMDLYASAGLAVSSRFHGLLFSVMGRTPLVQVCGPTSKSGRALAERFPSLTRAAILLDHANRNLRIGDAIEFVQPVGEEERSAAIEGARENVQHFAAAFDRKEVVAVEAIAIDPAPAPAAKAPEPAAEEPSKNQEIVLPDHVVVTTADAIQLAVPVGGAEAELQEIEARRWRNSTLACAAKVLKPGDKVVDLDPGFLYFASAFGSLVSKAGSVSVAYEKSKGEPILKQYRALNGKGGGAAIKLCDAADAKQLSKACDDASLVRLRLSGQPAKDRADCIRAIRSRSPHVIVEAADLPAVRNAIESFLGSEIAREGRRIFTFGDSDLVERPIYEIAQLDETTLLLQLEEAHHG
ncbi:polysaccharide pyruvyl transferase family protein [Inquilinus sp. CA228]|uniref:polysaccharide pyruvyl transferase family protein n=1 Tax=Inquilinus sp. CA228 TaxID=3455609 RepID=UPI003F8D7BD3